jgi:hypothetical protein
VLWDTASRWGIDSQFDYLREDRAGAANDQLWLGDANVVYRFAQSPQLQMRTGLGVNWMSDTEGTDLGFNFTYGGDLFIAKPWIVSAEIDWGWLGNAGLFRGRTTLGVHLHRWEFYTGYEYLDVGRTQRTAFLAACGCGTEHHLRTNERNGSRSARASAQCHLLCSGTARAVRYYRRKTGRLAPLR